MTSSVKNTNYQPLTDGYVSIQNKRMGTIYGWARNTRCFGTCILCLSFEGHIILKTYFLGITLSTILCPTSQFFDCQLYHTLSAIQIDLESEPFARLLNSAGSGRIWASRSTSGVQAVFILAKCVIFKLTRARAGKG
jgi:hypothetical protein